MCYSRILKNTVTRATLPLLLIAAQLLQPSGAFAQEVATSSDLSIFKTAELENIESGSTQTYTIVATNNGPDTANSIVVNDSLPSGGEIISVDSDDNHTTSVFVAGVVNTFVGTLQPGESTTIIIEATVEGNGPNTNTASVRSGSCDPDQTNNTATVRTVQTAGGDGPGASLSISKVAREETVAVGEELTYDILIVNEGPADAEEVVITDKLPSGADFVTSSSENVDNGVELDGIVSFVVGDLAVGEDAMVTLTVRPNFAGLIANVVSVRSSTNASGPLSENTVTEFTVVEGVPCSSADLTLVDLQTTKTASDDVTTVGENLTYTIKVANNGETSATGVMVTDRLPQGVILISSSVSPSGACSRNGQTVTCLLGTLLSGDSSEVTLVVQPTETGTIVNTATARSNQQDGNPVDNAGVAVTEVQPSPDATANLSITKTARETMATVGEIVTYDIEVTNQSEDTTAGQVIVTDVLQDNVTFVSATPSQGICTRDGSTVTCRLGSIAPLDTQSIVLQVRPNAAGPLNNSANVRSNVTDDNQEDNMDDAEPVIIELPATDVDLAITKTASPESVVVGQTLTYTITVNNQGTTSATGVTVTDVLPASVTPLSEAVTPNGTCSRSGQTVTCTVATLSPGATSVITLQVVPNETGSIFNTAIVTSNEADRDTANNTSDRVESNVVPAPNVVADLSVVKTSREQSVTVGQTITYDIAVSNLSGVAASGVIVTDVLPSNVSFVSAVPTQGACARNGATVTCNLGTLAANGTQSIVLQVQATVEGQVSNSAIIRSNATDQMQENNSSTDVIDVTSVNQGNNVDLSITKTASPAPVIVGQTLTYTIVVSNNGTATATGVVVTDALPAGVTPVSEEITPAGTCSRNDMTVTCSIDTLAPGASSTITIHVVPTQTGSIFNTATVAGNEPENNTANNTSGRVESNVMPVPTMNADLSIIKTADVAAAILGQTITYNITVTNGSSSVAANEVIVTDVLQDNAVLVNVTSSQGVCVRNMSTISCNLGTLAPNATANISLQVQPTMPGRLTNTATVRSNTTDDIQSNNASVAVTEVSLIPNCTDLTGMFKMDPFLECVTNKKGKSKCDLLAWFVLQNYGTIGAKKVSIKFFLSDDTVLNAGDKKLGSFKFKSVGPGAVNHFDPRFKKQKTSPVGKYIIAVIDEKNKISECNEDNNIIVSPQIPGQL